MAYLTDRKRATGMGSAKSGTAHHWSMTVSSVGLLVLVPLFLFTFGRILGSSYEDVLVYYARPFPAIIAALTIVVGFMHFKNGVRVLIIAMICLSYAAAATGLFAIARLAL